MGKKTVDDFLDYLDKIVINIIKDEFPLACVNHYDGIEYFSKFKERTYEKILNEFNHLEHYKIESSLDYEKLSKAIAHFYNVFEEQLRLEIVNNSKKLESKIADLLIKKYNNSTVFKKIKSELRNEGVWLPEKELLEIFNQQLSNIKPELEKYVSLTKNVLDLNVIDYLDENIKKYYKEYNNFKEIKSIKIELGYSFDGKGYFNIEKNMYEVYVQATSSKKLNQTDLIFNTVTQRENKKIYILSDAIPKENVDKFFKINGKEEKNKLFDVLEVVRFLFLSLKVFTKENDKTNENKNLPYFFSIIFINSKGFKNYHNKKLAEIFLNQKDYKIIDFFKYDFLKNKNLQEIEHKIQKYMEDIFKYLLNTINFDYLNKGPNFSEPMSNILSYIHGLTTYYLETSPIRDELRDKININYEYQRINKNYELKEISIELLNKKINHYQDLIKNRKAHAYKNNFNDFIVKIENSYIQDCNLKNTLDVDLKYSDKEILRVFFENYGNSFANLSYRFKDREEVNYEKIKEFKKYIVKRIKKTFINLNSDNLKEIYLIFNGYSNNLTIQSIIIFLLFKGDNISKDFLNSFKIFLIELVLFPDVLNNKNYSNLIHSFKDYMQYNENKNELNEIINEYKNLQNNILPQDFIGKINLELWDYIYIYNNLNDECNILREYALFKMREHLIGKRIKDLVGEKTNQLVTDTYELVLNGVKKDSEYEALNVFFTQETIEKAKVLDGLIMVIKYIESNVPEAFIYYNKNDIKISTIKSNVNEVKKIINKILNK